MSTWYKYKLQASYAVMCIWSLSLTYVSLGFVQFFLLSLVLEPNLPYHTTTYQNTTIQKYLNKT